MNRNNLRRFESSVIQDSSLTSLCLLNVSFAFESSVIQDSSLTNTDFDTFQTVV